MLTHAEKLSSLIVYVNAGAARVLLPSLLYVTEHEVQVLTSCDLLCPIEQGCIKSEPSLGCPNQDRPVHPPNIYCELM